MSILNGIVTYKNHPSTKYESLFQDSSCKERVTSPSFIDALLDTSRFYSLFLTSFCSLDSKDLISALGFSSSEYLFFLVNWLRYIYFFKE